MFTLAALMYVTILFFVLSPGILLSLPPGGNKMMVAVTHAAIFAVVVYFTLGYFVDEDAIEPFKGARAVPRGYVPKGASGKERR